MQETFLAAWRGLSGIRQRSSVHTWLYRSCTNVCLRQAEGAATARSAAAQPAEERYAPVVREVLQAELAAQVLQEQAWPALAVALAKAEQLGAQSAEVLAAARDSGS